MSRYLAVGLSILAGVALVETALIPGMVVGGVAVLAATGLRRLGRRRQSPGSVPTGGAAVRSRSLTGAGPQLPIPSRLGVGRAVAKTVTFRVIVTSLDFTANYLVIGELAAAAGLSTLSLVAGPLFYFAHETAWNYYGPAEPAVDLAALASIGADARAPRTARPKMTISRAVAKTITFRTVATAVDFTANYVVVGELATAAILSAFGFVVGPFVYLGHEMVWDHYAPPQQPNFLPAPPRLLPASA